MEKKVNQSRVLRKRGRPAGKDRVPLSQSERRARNAQYERGRRVEMTDALSDLAAVVGCKSSISHADVLATVITQLQQASRVKHSSDLESLKRCNKNLLAQIETLEARIAESDGGSSAPVKQEEVSNMPRPVKRKRDDYEHHVDHDNGYTPVPDCSPPECKYTPPVYTGPKYFPEPLPSPIYFPEQQFVPESNYSPESILQDHHHSIHPEPECSSKQQFEPMEPQYPVYSATHQYCLPVLRVSPLSDTSDHLPAEPNVVDYSSFNFAGAQLPTPEYQITSELSDYIVPVQQYSHEYCEYQPSPQCLSGPFSPVEQYSPSSYMSMVPELHYRATINQQPTFEVPVLPVMGSVGILPMPWAAPLYLASSKQSRIPVGNTSYQLKISSQCISNSWLT